MNNPYETLGVSREATDEQIKQAYRNLSRDLHSSEDAARMDELNAAYDAIMNERRGGGTGGQAAYTAADDLGDIRDMINRGQLDQAQMLLDGVPVQNRSALWYYLNGTVQYRRGYFDQAYTSFAAACRMDPQNAEYARVFREIQRHAGGFSGNGNPYRTGGNMGGMTPCDCCSSLICADCCCEMMGGDLIRCC